MDESTMGGINMAVLSVLQLNEYVKGVLEDEPQLQAVAVKGEISNFIHHRSGHMYFTLKDEDSQIKAVMFKNANMRLQFRPKDGQKVVVTGAISVYSPGGQYQLYVNAMKPDGIGDLYQAYEELKRRLAEEGLFDARYKKPLPAFPQKIGVITSANGAAVRDIINVAGRRCPMAQLLLYPAQVQGAGTELSLISALEYMENRGDIDVIIIGRGGGSIEDLWGFNSEKLARKIFALQTPIISAVGHETDFTICDFVSDKRAPTPSAAAEIAVPSQLELLSKISTMSGRMQTAVINGLKNRRLRVEKLSMRSPQNRIDDLRQKNDNLIKQAEKSFLLTFEGKKKELSKICAKLDALSPLGVMARGYAIATEEDGSVIRTVKNMTPGKEFSLRLSDGVCDCMVKEK